MRKSSLIQKTFVTLMLLVLSLGCDGSAGNRVGPDKTGGVRAPEFKLPNPDGEMVSLSDFTGKVVVLNFWATWCALCRIEIPFLIDLYSRYRSRQVVVIGVALDAAGPEVLKDFVEQAGINYPVLIGGDKVSSDYGGIFGVPTTFMINRQGMIAQRHVGVAEEALLEQEVLALLDKKE